MRIAAILAVFVGFACARLRAADEKEMKTDDEGFVRHWLILAPFPLADGQTGVEGLDKQQVNGEAKLKPKEGDTVKAGDAPLKWTKYEANEHYIDFNAHLGNVTEDSVAYAVCYLVADKPTHHREAENRQRRPVQGVFERQAGSQEHRKPRARKGSGYVGTRGGLKQGVNVIVFNWGVKSEKGGFLWGCLRLVDKSEKPIAGLKVDAQNPEVRDVGEVTCGRRIAARVVGPRQFCNRMEYHGMPRSSCRGGPLSSLQ